MENLSAFVLAGGRSTRMGADKAFLEVDGQPLIARMVRLARAVAQNTRIVGDREKLAAFGDVIEDLYPGRGPLGGIHTALSASTSVWNLILAVDLPFLRVAFLEFLVAAAQSSDAVVTVPFAAEHFHPLCAVYRKEFCAHAQRALSARQNKVDALFQEVQTQIITPRRLVAAGFHAEIFRNVNTEEDWERAKRNLTRLHL